MFLVLYKNQTENALKTHTFLSIWIKVIFRFYSTNVDCIFYILVISFASFSKMTSWFCFCSSEKYRSETSFFSKIGNLTEWAVFTSFLCIFCAGAVCVSAEADLRHIHHPGSSFSRKNWVLQLIREEEVRIWLYLWWSYIGLNCCLWIRFALKTRWFAAEFSCWFS